MNRHNLLRPGQHRDGRETNMDSNDENRCGATRGAIACGLALALGGTPGWSHVTAAIDPHDRAGEAGVSISELDEVEVVIYGSDHVNVKKIKRKSLRLGGRKFDGQPQEDLRAKTQDVNGDGIRDLLVTFDTERSLIRERHDVYAVVRGILRGAGDFEAVAPLEDENPCQSITNNDGLFVGVRCSYATSQEDLDFNQLVVDINQNISGSTRIVDRDSAVVIEVFGGDGHVGKEVEDDCGNTGAGADGGYARTVQTVTTVENTLADGATIYAYVGEKGPAYQSGGSGSVVIGEAINFSPSATDPVAANVLAIAGGGGGGGKASENDFGDCDRGYDGGVGGSAIATISAPGNGAGSDGGNKHKGRGGNQDGNGSGGSNNNNGDGGNDGIGGFGARGGDDSTDDVAGWAGTTLSSSDWPHGEGGRGGDGGKAGGGGGGYGGGGGGQAKENKGGGGGGGSWAAQSVVDEDSIDSALILEESYNSGGALISITFQVK